MSSNGSRHAVLLLVTLAGALALAAPAAAHIDNGVLSINGQRGPSGGYLWLDARLRNTDKGAIEPMEEGSGFTLALQHAGAEEPDVWGAASPPGRWFPVAGGEPVRGSGTAADPLVERRTMRAGADLEVVEELRLVRGEPHFVARWTVRNAGAAPVNFRATAMANYGDPTDRPNQVSRAIAELGSLRRLGSEVPEGGLPPEYTLPGQWGGDGIDPEGRGTGGLMEELPGSPWAHAELGPAGEVLARVKADQPARGRYASGYLDAAAAAEWDRYVLGTPGLAPGDSTSFEVRYRLIDELRYDWTGSTGPGCTARVHLDTAFGRRGPRPGLRIVVRRDFEWGSVTLHTDAAGVARAELSNVRASPWPPLQWGGWTAWIDADGDGTQDIAELQRQARSVENEITELCPAAAAAAPTAAPRARPALRLVSATRRGRRVIVRARIARAATGRVRLAWSGRRRARSARRTVQLRPRAGRIARTIVLSRSAASARRQRVTLAYPGSKRFAPAKVSLRVRRARH